jgi:hypothetical protein
VEPPGRKGLEKGKKLTFKKHQGDSKVKKTREGEEREGERERERERERGCN